MFPVCVSRLPLVSFHVWTHSERDAPTGTSCVPAPPGIFLPVLVDGFGRNSMAAVVDATSVPVLSTLHGRQHPESVPAPSHGRYQLILTLVWLSDESLRKRRGPTAV